VSSRLLSDLKAPFRLRAEAWVERCKAAGLDVLVYCTLRDLDEQARLYAQGRTTPGKIVTNAKPGQSAHNYGLALDFVPLVGGKPEWKPGERYAQAIALAEAEGMESASKWTRFREYPHLQEPNWRNYL
jgi:peptidoglycan L-alanyl-D-glutamate endopeptidase CwlK